MTRDEAERIWSEWNETFTQRLVEAFKLLAPAIQSANREVNLAVAEMHEYERRQRPPRMRDNLGRLHRRYRRQP